MTDAKKKPDTQPEMEEDSIKMHDPVADDATVEPIDIMSEMDGDIDDTIERLTTERDDMRDRFMRALADAENARKRGERDRREAEQYGGAKLSRDMLPVFDNLKRALETITEEQKEVAGPVIEGVELTLKELISVFKKHGIEPISPEIGEKFDPQLHQAMFEAPVPGTKAGDIIQVMADGFILHERLLRPAQVGVSSTPES